MTNKMRLIFVVATAVSVVFAVLSTPFAVDITDRVLSVIAKTLGLHEAPAPFALAVLVIPGLYLAFVRYKHWGKGPEKPFMLRKYD